MIDRFEELLHELSKELTIALHPDRIGACTLIIEDGPSVQLECDKTPGNLLIGSFLCEIPPGKFRENILRDALKANDPFPENGILAYCEGNDQLLLFSSHPMTELTGPKLSNLLHLFIEKAIQWRTAVETNTTSTLLPSTSKPSSGMFGLR